jgi:RNA polymerase sigma factor (sigma-70 family)
MSTSGGAESASLAERILVGEREAEAELVQLFGPPVFALLCARTRDREASRDLLQDVLLVVLRAVREGRLREPEKLAGFVTSTARNVAQSYMRGRARDRRHQPLDINLAAPIEKDRLELAERQARVQQGLMQLDSIDQEILRQVLEARKPEAIGRSLGMSAEAVRQRKSRALKKLAEFVKGL